MREIWRLTCNKLGMALTADIQRAFVEGGTKTVVTRSIRKIVRPAFKIGSLVFTECNLSKPVPERPRVPGVVAREATIDDARLFEDRALFLERFNHGHRCFVGIEERTGKLTNYRWVNTSAAFIPELDRYLILKPGDAYVYDLNTLPEFRKRGIDAYTRYFAYSHLRETGYHRILAYIHGDNYPSLRASRHVLKRIGRVWYLEFRGCAPIMFGGRGTNFPELQRL
jgi:ribosomal protein S18 acetylase RimI-like enzyme